MGEIADMMLEGDLCEGCGIALDDGGYGIPRYCSDGCAKDRGFDYAASDGAGAYHKPPKLKQEAQKCLSIKITHDGRPVFDKGHTLRIKGADYEQSRQFAQEVNILVDKYFTYRQSLVIGLMFPMLL